MTAVGARLPALCVEVTPTFVVSTAIATQDFQDVHHDRDAAHVRGARDIFLNILTDTGLVQRFVTDWAGPNAVLRGIAVRLGVPCYAGETLVLEGRVAAVADGEVTVEVVGRNSIGEHLNATVRVVLP